MIDQAQCFSLTQAYHQSLLEVFPNSAHLICWFHVQQAIMGWLTKHSVNDKETREGVVLLMQRLQESESEKIFKENWKTVSAALHRIGGPDLQRCVFVFFLVFFFFLTHHLSSVT